MLKSNCKKAKENIRTYIMNHSDFNGYGLESEPQTFKETASALMEIFHDEKLKHNRNIKNYQDEFIDWLQGLPSVFDSLYYYNRSAVADLGDILEETENERRKFSEQKAERILSCLIYRELLQGSDYRIW